MKILLLLFLTSLIFVSCQKKISESQSVNGETVASTALTPLKFHATNFATNYPIVKGKTPPFTFSKTQYTDGRVKTLHLVTRALPNLTFPSSFTGGQYFIWDYIFSYGLNKAYITGKRTSIEPETGYTNTVDIGKLVVDFNSYGYAIGIHDFTSKYYLIELTYNQNKLVSFMSSAHREISYPGGYSTWNVTTDARGNITKLKKSPYGIDGYDRIPVEVSYTYNSAVTGKRYMHQTTQYAVSLWYNLLEVMQWVPSSIDERKSVSLTFQTKKYNSTTQTYDIPFTVVQGQKYLNQKYDVNGNLISYTYADGVLQKITWK